MKRPDHINAIITQARKDWTLADDDLYDLLEYIERKEKTVNQVTGQLSCALRVWRQDTAAYRAERQRCRVIHGGRIS